MSMAPTPEEVYGYHQRATRNTPVSLIRKHAVESGKSYFAVGGKVYFTDSGCQTRWSEIDVEMAVTPETKT